MKKNICRLSNVTFFVCCSAFSSPYDEIQPGNYSYSQKGDELINGQNASITWEVNIKNRHDAIVTISSWHASFTCEGSYVISNAQGHIALSWVAERNVRTECDLPAPQILMKKSSSGTILIHSQLFPWESEGWYKVRKIK